MYYNYTEISSILDCSISKVGRIVKKQGFKCFKKGRERLIRRDDIHSYLESSKIEIFTRNQIYFVLNDMGHRISLKKLYKTLVENRLYSLDEVVEMIKK